MTQKEIKDSIINDMELGKHYSKDNYVYSFAKSKRLSEQEVRDALESIPSNIVENTLDDQDNIELIRKIRVPMP